MQDLENISSGVRTVSRQSLDSRSTARRQLLVDSFPHTQMLNLALIWDFVIKNIIFKEFNYTLKWVDDGAYGSKSKETGEWNGMLGEILENVRPSKYFQQYLFN